MRRSGSVLAAAAALAACPSTAAAASWSVSSPDGDLRATVTQSRTSVPLRLTVRRDGRHVLTARINPAGRSRSRTRRRVSEDFTTPAGKRRAHRLRARQLTLAFQGLRLHVRAANDGVAYRTVLHGRERAAFTAPRGATAWLQRYSTNYERPYGSRRIRSAKGRWGFPALLNAGHGTWALLTESAVDGGYSAAHLRSAGGGLALELPRVRARRTVTTPWRVAVVGDLATVAESDLALALGARSRVRDTSWIRPGRVAWSWWSNSLSPRDPAAQQRYVDYAAARGWEYVTVDEGWDPAWIPALVAYARARGVGILLWARYSDLNTPAERRAALQRFKAWGVAGVKLDFIASDAQRLMRWYADVARETAAAHLVVDFHGTTVPRGIQRTWPNVLTMEAVRGAEHYKGGSLPAAANTVLPFTRNAIGSMDYTPVTFSTANRRTTDAHELALSVVFESGLQHFADSPESYAARPVAERFLSAVPAAWDDTRLLAGSPGRAATVARRRGDDWFVGSITAGARTVDVGLGFLASGRTYDATIVTEGLTEEHRTLTRDDRLRIALPAGGGFAVKLELNR